MFRQRNPRLILWILAITLALAGQRFRLGYIGLIGIFVLLCTTPADAIRLPRWISELLIFSCAAGLQISQHRPGVFIHLAIVMVMLAILRLWRQSAWWAVLYAWS